MIGTRRSVTDALPDADGADLVLPADRMLELAAESDFLVVCSQLTDETRGLINAEVFAVMKPGAVLINVARGEEVDEDALIEAVKAGRIRGAVLDVYDDELPGRPPRPELLELPQILLTPHISGGGDANVAEPLRRLFAENLRRYLDGPSSTWSTAPAATSRCQRAPRASPHAGGDRRCHCACHVWRGGLVSDNTFQRKVF